MNEDNDSDGQVTDKIIHVYTATNDELLDSGQKCGIAAILLTTISSP